MRVEKQKFLYLGKIYVRLFGRYSLVKTGSLLCMSLLTDQLLGAISALLSSY